MASPGLNDRTFILARDSTERLVWSGKRTEVSERTVDQRGWTETHKTVHEQHLYLIQATPVLTQQSVNDRASTNGTKKSWLVKFVAGGLEKAAEALKTKGVKALAGAIWKSLVVPPILAALVYWRRKLGL